MKRRRRASEPDDPDADPDSPDVAVDRNHVFFWCDCTKKSCLDLVLKLRALDRAYAQDEVPLFLHINSNGGCVDAALGAVPGITGLTSRVVSVVEGYAASAATLLSVVCDERRINRTAYLRIHQFRAGFWGKKDELDDEHANMAKLDAIITDIYKRHTSMTRKQIRRLLAREIDLHPDEAVKRGLADAVVG